MAPRTTPKKAASDDLDRYRARCTRWLSGHGDRSAAELLSTIAAGTEKDQYGAGGAVAALEAEICKVLGKPAAVFMPSGTMAQQIALRIHADRRNCRVVAFHPTCHLEIHEDKAYQRLHDLLGVTVGDPQKLMTLADLTAIPGQLAAVLFELPQREIGGVLPAWEDLTAQVDLVRRRGAAVHLDGARLWESTPFYRKKPAEIAALFDTVYVSFYKGLGGLAGACLAGEEDVIVEARAWRRRHGGTLYGMWPNAAAALTGLQHRLPRMPAYYRHAKAIAQKLREAAGVEVLPDPPHTNMMRLLLRVDEKRLAANACRIAREQGVYTFKWNGPGQSANSRIVELSVGDATLQFEPEEVAGLIRRLVDG
ncbi:MAG: low specificity L-threonine aldolase [Candidatus Eisenbacteria bacterium]